MNTSRLIFVAVMLALTGATAWSADKSDKGAARLTQMLLGRTAGEPVNCVTAFKSSKIEVIEGVALVYDAGDILYVARPTDPETLGRDDIMVIDRFGGQLCHTDIIRTVDRHSGFFTGVVFLGKFVPYRKQN